jgi:hypothetical protein
VEYELNARLIALIDFRIMDGSFRFDKDILEPSQVVQRVKVSRELDRVEPFTRT